MHIRGTMGTDSGNKWMSSFSCHSPSLIRRRVLFSVSLLCLCVCLLLCAVAVAVVVIRQFHYEARSFFLFNTTQRKQSKRSRWDCRRFGRTWVQGWRVRCSEADGGSGWMLLCAVSLQSVSSTIFQVGTSLLSFSTSISLCNTYCHHHFVTARAR